MANFHRGFACAQKNKRRALSLHSISLTTFRLSEFKQKMLTDSDEKSSASLPPPKTSNAYEHLAAIFASTRPFSRLSTAVSCYTDIHALKTDQQKPNPNSCPA